jgi:hypothetical protein
MVIVKLIPVISVTVTTTEYGSRTDAPARTLAESFSRRSAEQPCCARTFERAGTATVRQAKTSSAHPAAATTKRSGR